jgi:hypothetical protein
VAEYFADQCGYEFTKLVIPGSEVRAEALAQGQIDASILNLADIMQLSADTGHGAPRGNGLTATATQAPAACSTDPRAHTTSPTGRRHRFARSSTAVEAAAQSR